MDTNRSATTNVNAPDTTERRGRGCGCWIALLVVLLLGGGAAAYLGGTFALRQKVPLEPEAVAADLGKRWLMVPPEFVDWQMPAALREDLPSTVAKGKELYDVECALCHGAGGNGESTFGKAMFPPAVALTRHRTQDKTQGQLYYLIAHGVNYTGMPGWGKEFPNGIHDQNEIWSLVAYVESLGTP